MRRTGSGIGSYQANAQAAQIALALLCNRASGRSVAVVGLRIRVRLVEDRLVR